MSCRDSERQETLVCGGVLAQGGHHGHVRQREQGRRDADFSHARALKKNMYSTDVRHLKGKNQRFLSR